MGINEHINDSYRLSMGVNFQKMPITFLILPIKVGILSYTLQYLTINSWILNVNFEILPVKDQKNTINFQILSIESQNLPLKVGFFPDTCKKMLI